MPKQDDLKAQDQKEETIEKTNKKGREDITEDKDEIPQESNSDSKRTEEIAQLKQENEELENQYKRALADYQNLQKRSAEERQNWIRAANKELLLRLFPVLDTLMLAYKHDQNNSIKVCIGQFHDTLKAEGVTRIKTEGEKFNPETMECVTTTDGEEGKVIEEIRAGYLIYDKLLRPAQVIVGKKEERSWYNIYIVIEKGIANPLYYI